MIRRGLFLADGPSDAPLGDHLEALCAACGCEVRITTPDLRRLPGRVGLTVEDRLRYILGQDTAYDVVFVHRDAEGQPPEQRRREIAEAVSAVRCAIPTVPIVPIRMTEAWLLLDERAIREVAGKPSGTVDLRLPPVRTVESVPDPKQRLREALVTASQLRGRRLEAFKQRFGDHRRQLLERIDHAGPISMLSAWQDLLRAIRDAVPDLTR
jgi:hypothetical protein